jgi:uncharacterized protein YbjT (DUF2867 family)
MILVAGATGWLGGEVCRTLAERGHPVRALVRPTSDPAKREALRAAGVELVEGDLRDADSLQRACAGVGTVISTATATGQPKPGDDVINVDGEGQLALVDAAEQAGTGHFIFVSLSGNLEVDTPLSNAKRAVEQRLAAGRMEWTVLRPAAFMEIWLSPMLGFDVPNGTVTVYGEGTAPISYVSLYDVARYCVVAVNSPAARNASIEIGGAAPVAPLEAVRFAEEVTGRALAVQHVPAAALRAQYEAATDPRDRSFAGLMLAMTEGDAIDMAETARRFDVQPRGVREFLAATYGGPPSGTPPGAEPPLDV